LDSVLFGVILQIISVLKDANLVKIGDISLGNFPLLLAPMEDVSDPPFRFLCKKHGADLMYTEFISSEGLIRDAVKSRQKLDIFDHERPIGIQIFGGDEEAMAMATRIVDATQPDLVTSAVVKSTNLPVTVKTRLGWDEKTKNIEEVAERLQDVGVKALSVHGRTRTQLYKGEADWTLIAKVKDNPRIQIPIFGNGDIDTPEKALEYKNRYGVDGIMIGRASIGHPWIFREIKHFMATGEKLALPTFDERVEACLTHLQKSVEWKSEIQAINEMKRHYANYFKGIPNFKAYKTALVTSNDLSEIYALLEEIRHKEFVLAD
jgi:tRNA-dihydrouridine synthase B